MNSPTVLIIDDEPDIVELLEMTLQRMQVRTCSAATMSQALNKLGKQRFDLCLTDMRLPDGDGLTIVRHIQQHYPQTPVAMITAYGSLDTAISALKAGAFDFLTKPVDLQRLRELVSNALRLSLSNPEQKNVMQDEADPILGISPPIAQLRSQIAKLARSQAPLYISGESGSGKELVARRIHALGARSQTRQLYWCHSGQARAVSSSIGRHPVSGRGRRPAHVHAGETVTRNPGKIRAPARHSTGRGRGYPAVVRHA